MKEILSKLILFEKLFKKRRMKRMKRMEIPMSQLKWTKKQLVFIKKKIVKINLIKTFTLIKYIYALKEYCQNRGKYINNKEQYIALLYISLGTSAGQVR